MIRQQLKALAVKQASAQCVAGLMKGTAIKQ